ncbi:MAG: MFS transporter [Sphingobacteriia bacterium]|nr:MFS transporter [Sphingobacteriia bacterium]
MYRKYFLPYLMWFFAVFFFAYQFIMRLAPGLVINDLITQYQITATSFGIFSAIYYIGYAGAQLPTAYLLEKFKTKYIIGIFCIIASIGTYILSYTTSFSTALVGRLMIGIGSAAGFLGVSKVVATYFPEKLYARLIGFSFTIGIFGAVYGGKPVNSLIETFNYNKVFFLIAAIGTLIALTILLFGDNRKANYLDSKKDSNLIEELFIILKNKRIVLIAIANLLMVGSLEGFADVWGISFLTKAFDISKGDAATVISYIFIGMLFGGPALAFISEKYFSKTLVIFLCGLLTCILFLGLIIFPNLSFYLLCALMFINGILCCYQVLIFALGTEIVKNEYKSIAIAFLNCVNMLGGIFFHTLIGLTLDHFWQGDISNNVKLYSLYEYKIAIAIIPISSIIGGMLVIYSGLKKDSKKITQTI